MYKKINNTIQSFNPATKELIGEIKITTSNEIKLLVQKCKESFLIWSSYSYNRRSKAMNELANLLESNAEELAILMTKEMGRPLSESFPEVIKSIKFIRFFAQNAEKMLSDFIIREVPEKNVKIIAEPYGVAALIKPWNMPLQTPIWSMAPALMAGNAVVFKPSENTLLVAKELEKLINKCDLIPKNLVGFIYGDKEQGIQLLKENIDMVSFTGSVNAGKSIAKQVSDRFIKTSLELGGKDPMIVFNDANIDFAAMAAVWGSTTNCGQFCSSVERVYVEESIYDEFIEKVKILLQEIKVGSLASDFLLRANDINIFRCYIDGLNIASSISEFDACKNLYDNFDVISIYGFENLIFSLEEISNCYCNPPTHNFIPRGRDLLTISLAYPVAQHYKCGYISHSCERDLWEGNIFVNGKSIPLHDSQSKLVMLPLNKQMKVSTDIHVFSPIAGMYEIYILKWIIMKYPDKFKLIQSCFYGSWCGECSKCLRYYLVEKYCGVNLLKFKNNPELQIPNLVRKLVQDNYEYGFSKELKFLLGIKEDEEDLFLPIRDSLFPEFLRKCNLK